MKPMKADVQTRVEPTLPLQKLSANLGNRGTLILVAASILLYTLLLQYPLLVTYADLGSSPLHYADAFLICLLWQLRTQLWPLILVPCFAIAALSSYCPSLFSGQTEISAACDILTVLLSVLFLRQRFFHAPDKPVTRVTVMIYLLCVVGVGIPALVYLLTGISSHLLSSEFLVTDWINRFVQTAGGNIALMPLGLLLSVYGLQPLLNSLKRRYALVALLATLLLTALAPQLLIHPFGYINVALIAVAVIGHFPVTALTALLCSIIAGLSFHNDSLDKVDQIKMLLPIILTLISPVLFGVVISRMWISLGDLKQRKQHYDLLYRRTPVMMQSLDSSLRIISTSDALAQRLGYSPDELVGCNLGQFVAPTSNAQLFGEWLPELQHNGRLENHSILLCHKEGYVIEVMLNAVVEWSKNEQSQILVVVTDLSEQRRLATALQEEKELVEATLQAIGDGVITTDAAGRITYLNPVAEQLLECSLDEARGMLFNSIVVMKDEQTGLSYNPIAQCLSFGKTPQAPEHILLSCPNAQHEYGIQHTVTPIRNADESIIGVVMIFQDVTQSRQLTRRMTYLAHHDLLTQLPNRAMFQEQLEAACLLERSFSIVFVDLDHFKNINDSLGHATGDELIRQAARRLRSTLRDGDQVCRLGGDEFVLMLKGLDTPEAISALMDRIINAVTEPYLINEHELRITASLGISIYPQDGSEPASLMKHADTAMYRAKRDGRNRYHFFSPLADDAALTRLALENDMRADLGSDNFVLHYQPIVDASNRNLHAIEVLVRWYRRGAEKMTPPDQFIPVAEESRLIVPLGLEILRRALTQFAQWQQQDELKQVHLAVNVSAVQLASPSFVSDVQQALADSGVNARDLELEITESVLMSDPVLMKSTLMQIRDLGISIAVDDFGTGYSSLSYLKRFPVNKVKIDRSFVRDIADDPNDEALVRAILALAFSLGLSTVAEGVETETQAELLSRLRCPALQGYLFSRPLPADEFSHMVKKLNAAASDNWVI